MKLAKKRAAILTLDFYNNFGSVLQAYALRETIQKMGLDADILPYRPKVPHYQYFTDQSLLEQYERKKFRFQKFREEQLGRTCIDITSGADLSKDYNAYIVGSDIIWGKEFSALDSAYFLDFVPEGKKRIAYAASMVLKEGMHSEDDAIFKEFIPRFDAISVRERETIDFLRIYTDQKISHVLDPSLLLGKEEYSEIMIENEIMYERPYLLCYFLTHDPAVVDYSILLAQKLGLRIIHFYADYPDNIFPGDSENFAFAGPREFLGYVKNAACIFTNSFHGTCFSIIFRKPFYAYMGKRNLTSRISGLIEQMYLQTRFFYDFCDIKKVDLNIDYNLAEKMLDREREKSITFLRESLVGM